MTWREIQRWRLSRGRKNNTSIDPRDNENFDKSIQNTIVYSRINFVLTGFIVIIIARKQTYDEMS